MNMKPTDRNRRERGAALVVAILVLAILTVIGIALMLITSTEARIAANEWSINRAFYSSDAGIRWAGVGELMGSPWTGCLRGVKPQQGARLTTRSA